MEKSQAQGGAWHPVKVHRDANGNAHLFDVWDGNQGSGANAGMDG